MKIIVSRLVLVLAIVASLIVNTSLTFAAAQLLETEVTYTIGEGDSLEVGIERAKQKALRAAQIKSGDLLIKTASVMENNSMLQDKIEVYSSSILKLEGDPVITKDFLDGGDAIKITYKIKFWVNPDEFVEKFSNVSAEKVENQVKMNKDQETYNEKNEIEVADLREKYKKATNDNERQQVTAEIKRNEEKFMATQLFKRGQEAYNRGNLNEAINLYNQAISTDSKYAAPFTELGWIYNDQGNYSKAIEYFQKSIALYGDIAVPYNGLSYAYNFSKDFNKAIEYGNKAVQIDPKYAAAWNNIGFAYKNLGNFGKAIENYNKAISITPNNDVSLSNIGNVYFSQKDYAKAMEYYRKSVNINSKQANAWYHLGHIYGQQEDISQAIDSYKKATSIDPKHVRAWIMLGYLNNKKENFESAQSCFKKALKLNPNSAQAWAGLGYSLDKLGNYSESYEAYKKAVELEPTNKTYQTNAETAKTKIG